MNFFLFFFNLITDLTHLFYFFLKQTNKTAIQLILETEIFYQNVNVNEILFELESSAMRHVL